jgi:hypothetical protein
MGNCSASCLAAGGPSSGLLSHAHKSLKMNSCWRSRAARLESDQPKLWFGKIERDIIARGVFTSVPDLARKIKRYIRAYSANAKPNINQISRGVPKNSMRYPCGGRLSMEQRFLAPQIQLGQEHCQVLKILM